MYNLLLKMKRSQIKITQDVKTLPIKEDKIKTKEQTKKQNNF